MRCLEAGSWSSYSDWKSAGCQGVDSRSRHEGYTKVRNGRWIHIKANSWEAHWVPVSGFSLNPKPSHQCAVHTDHNTTKLLISASTALLRVSLMCHNPKSGSVNYLELLGACLGAFGVVQSYSSGSAASASRINCVAPGPITTPMLTNVDWEAFMKKLRAGPSSSLAGTPKMTSKLGAATAVGATQPTAKETVATAAALTRQDVGEDAGFEKSSSGSSGNGGSGGDAKGRTDEEVEGLVGSMVALGRAGRPEEVASLVVWLCCEGSYVTGQSYRVDGAWAAAGS